MKAFVSNQLKKNANVTVKDISIRDSYELPNHKEWKVFIVEMKGSVKQKANVRDFESQDILFASDTLIAPDLIDPKSGQSIKNSVSPSFKSVFYKKDNLLMGNANAKHKLVLFSDPLCPFCMQLVDELVAHIKDHPKTFALYYYHFPLVSIHPASKTVVKAMSAAINKGHKDILHRTYKAKFDAHETNEKKVLTAFNKALNTNLSMADINDKSVLKHIESDKYIASQMLINSTPTLFMDGKKDATRKAYKEVKLID